MRRLLLGSGFLFLWSADDPLCNAWMASSTLGVLSHCTKGHPAVRGSRRSPFFFTEVSNHADVSEDHALFYWNRFTRPVLVNRVELVQVETDWALPPRLLTECIVFGFVFIMLFKNKKSKGHIAKVRT